jgi:5,6,7,8-tetrahydromethanopterin hydro-lyase
MHYERKNRKCAPVKPWLPAGDPVTAEPELIIGELDGPVGTAIAAMIAIQVQGHTWVFAL